MSDGGDGSAASGTAAYYQYWGKSCEDGGEVACHLLPYHSLDVAAVGRVYLEKHPFLAGLFARALDLERGEFIRLACFFLALHDLGKFSENFQGQLDSLFRRLRGRAPRGARSERHDSLGYALWREHIQELALAENWFGFDPNARRSQRALTLWAAAVMGHHGQPPSTMHKWHRMLPIDSSRAFTADDRAAAERFARDVRHLFLPNPPRLDVDTTGERLKRASWWLAGLTVLCDWIGSNRAWFGCCDATVPLDHYWRDVALPSAERAVAASGVLPAASAPEGDLHTLFPQLAASAPTPLQRLAQRLPLSPDPQLLILEDVTGAGKTEAAAVLAHRLAAAGTALGAYVALPTMATANAMYRRLAPVYSRFFSGGGQPSLVLAHGRRDQDRRFRDSLFEAADEGRKAYADGEESAGARCTAWLGDHRKKALLADFGVGTIDQALLAALPAKHQSLRLLGLTRKVLVIDEVHACDAYMLGVLRRLITFHSAAGGSTVLLSATLPRRTRQSLVAAYCQGVGRRPVPAMEADAYPLLTRVDREEAGEHPIATRPEVARSVAVELLHEVEAAEGLIESAANDGRCVCWIRNSVDDAIDAYRRLRDRLPPGTVRLFHARFALGDRLRIEDDVLATFGKDGGPTERRGRVLIATQVVEQSLDLDFDVMVSDLAPIDRLIQRAGRLHRHTRSADGARTGEADGRSPPLLHVLTPEPVTAPTAGWLTERLPRTAAVYPDHYRLWLTARLLAHGGRIRMPEDARTLIESVYGDGAEPAPPGLAASATEADGQRGKEISLARQNALDLEDGYRPRGGELDWWEDMLTPTRLGEPTVMLRLARVDGATVRPWCDEGWRASELSVRAARIGREGEHPLIEQARNGMADAGRWCVVLPLARVDGDWRGAAEDGRGEPVAVTYDPDEGLRFD